MIDKPIGYLLDGQVYKTMQFRKDGGAYEGQTAVFATGANANPDQHPAFAFRECDDSHAGEPVAWKHGCGVQDLPDENTIPLYTSPHRHESR